MTPSSQCSAILKHLQSGHSLTAMAALYHFRCNRLAGRIYEIKKLGYPIESQKVEINGKWVSQYRLAQCLL